MNSRAHDWPSVNETARLYEDHDGSYFLVFVQSEVCGVYDAVANQMRDPEPPSLASCRMSWAQIKACQQRIEWDELPDHWRDAFLPWLVAEPDSVRGLWRVNQHFAEQSRT